MGAEVRKQGKNAQNVTVKGIGETDQERLLTVQFSASYVGIVVFDLAIYLI